MTRLVNLQMVLVRLFRALYLCLTGRDPLCYAQTPDGETQTMPKSEHPRHRHKHYLLLDVYPDLR